MLGDLGIQRLNRTVRCKVNSKGPLSQTRGRKNCPEGLTFDVPSGPLASMRPAWESAWGGHSLESLALK